MTSRFSNFIQRWLVTTLGVLAAALLVPGIRYDDAGSLFLASLLLGLLNSFVRPILVIFTLPFVIFTLGLGLLVINASLLYFVGSALHGFHVAGFWAAFFGALIISFTSFGANLLLGRPSAGVGRGPQRIGIPPNRKAGGPYIDV